MGATGFPYLGWSSGLAWWSNIIWIVFSFFTCCGIVPLQEQQLYLVCVALTVVLTAKAAHGYIYVSWLAKKYLSLWKQENSAWKEILLPGRSRKQHFGESCCIWTFGTLETILLVFCTSACEVCSTNAARGKRVGHFPLHLSKFVVGVLNVGASSRQCCAKRTGDLAQMKGASMFVDSNWFSLHDKISCFSSCGMYNCVSLFFLCRLVAVGSSQRQQNFWPWINAFHTEISCR